MLIALILAAFLASVYSFPLFQNFIPNGKNVPNPCAGKSGVWDGVGHDRAPGAGPRNAFGEDFRSAVFTWTKELCQKDSDQDGRTNGQELGDPDCTWKIGGTPSAAATGHPGVCEPMNDSKCSVINKDIRCSDF